MNETCKRGNFCVCNIIKINNKCLDRNHPAYIRCLFSWWRKIFIYIIHLRPLEVRSLASLWQRVKIIYYHIRCFALRGYGVEIASKEKSSLEKIKRKLSTSSTTQSRNTRFGETFSYSQLCKLLIDFSRAMFIPWLHFNAFRSLFAVFGNNCGSFACQKKRLLLSLNRFSSFWW